MESLNCVRRERRLEGIAFCIALIVHCLALMVVIPEHNLPEPQRDDGPRIVVRRYLPPPPPLPPPRSTAAPMSVEKLRKLPIPDPTPQAPEPVQEPLAPIPEEAVLTDDALLLLASPEPMHDSGIAVAGVAGVTIPVLIQETKTEPEYPEAARIARAKGDVILQAIIGDNGAVQDVSLLRCSNPYLGFEESAMAAVRSWQYHPATRDGRPVPAYLTVLVSFDLL